MSGLPVAFDGSGLSLWSLVKPRPGCLKDNGKSWNEECRLWKRHDYTRTTNKKQHYLSTFRLVCLLVTLDVTLVRHIHSCIDLVPRLVSSRNRINAESTPNIFSSPARPRQGYCSACISLVTSPLTVLT